MERKKYVGILQIYEENMVGLHVTIKSRFYDTKEDIQRWFDVFPNAKNKLIFENTPAIEDFFYLYEDHTPTNKKEEEEYEKIKEWAKEEIKKWKNNN